MKKSLFGATLDLAYVSTFLEDSRSSSILLEHRQKLLAQGGRQDGSTQLLLNALRDGYLALSQSSKNALGDVVEEGKLLYAWEGTQVLRGQEGGAS